MKNKIYYLKLLETDASHLFRTIPSLESQRVLETKMCTSDLRKKFRILDRRIKSRSVITYSDSSCLGLVPSATDERNKESARPLATTEFSVYQIGP